MHLSPTETKNESAVEGHADVANTLLNPPD